MTETKTRDSHVWARDELDWYQEPTSVTLQLLEHEPDIRGPVLDPCCGAGNIVRACHEAGLEAWGHDLKRRADASWITAPVDFLTNPGNGWPIHDCLFNPPYFRAVGAEAFIRQALAHAQGMVAAFVDQRFLWGAGRANGLWRDSAPTRIWIVTPRPSCPPGEWIAAGNKPGGGTADYAWVVWDPLQASEETQIGWFR